jgi:hypothetical protein
VSSRNNPASRGCSGEPARLRGTLFIGGRAVALSVADVGARAPSWNHEAGFGTDLARAFPQCSAHLRLRSRVPLGLSERLVGRVGRAVACCDGGSGQDGFWRWAEGTGPRLPCPVLEVEQTRGEAHKLIEQGWLGARWTMNASRLRSNKEFSSQLQETNGTDTHGRGYRSYRTG